MCDFFGQIRSGQLNIGFSASNPPTDPSFSGSGSRDPPLTRHSGRIGRLGRVGRVLDLAGQPYQRLHLSEDFVHMCSLSVCLAKIIFANLFYYSAYFYYYLRVLLHFLVLFIGPTVLFQLTFTFIYSTFSKKISVSTK